MVKITVNASHSMFANLLPYTETLADGVTVGTIDPMDHVRIVVGTLDEPSLFYNFNTYPQNNSNVGDCATNHRILEVSKNRPLIFESNYDFALLGNVVNDAFQTSRALAPLVHLIRKGILIFEKDGVVQTADQVMQFTP